MPYDFQRSIAQKYVRFITSAVPSTVAGLNYGRVMIFVGDSDKATYFVTPPATPSITTVKATDYDDVTQGLLKTWLDGFFRGGSATEVYLVVYQDHVMGAWSDVDMGVQFSAYTERAYWKLSIHSTHNMESQLALATLCAADDLLSGPLLYGSHDATMLTGDTDNDAEELVAGGHDAMVFYHPLATENPALVQLGQTLSAANVAGIYVGNKLDFLQIAGFSASGTAGANLTAAESAMLDSLKVAYFTTVGDRSGNVGAEGKETLLGLLIGSEWVRDYVDFVAAVEATALMTLPGKFKNNDTYQGILLILQTKIDVMTRIGRFTNAKITAPAYAKLPSSAGDVIVVPNAWQADYVDNLRQVTVYGTLYVTL